LLSSIINRTDISPKQNYKELEQIIGNGIPHSQSTATITYIPFLVLADFWLPIIGS
jgi:hypothetical protein